MADQQRKYAKSHEWAQWLDDGTLRVGISDHAQAQLGDIVYVELPVPGTHVKAGQECAVVESVKAASDIYAPLDGEVVAVNDALINAPQLINEDPLGTWLFTMKPDAAKAFDELLEETAYLATVED